MNNLFKLGLVLFVFIYIAILEEFEVALMSIPIAVAIIRIMDQMKIPKVEIIERKIKFDFVKKPFIIQFLLIITSVRVISLFSPSREQYSTKSDFDLTYSRSLPYHGFYSFVTYDFGEYTKFRKFLILIMALL